MNNAAMLKERKQLFIACRNDIFYKDRKYTHRRKKSMPTVIVEADEGRTVEQKRGLVKEITEAVCKNFKVEPQAVTIIIHEGKKENRGKSGKLAID